MLMVIYVCMELIENLIGKGNRRERKDRVRPELFFFVTNTHPTETATSIMVEEVKKYLEATGFGIPIVILRVGDNHYIKDQTIPWYLAAANKGMEIRSELRDDTVDGKLKANNLKRNQVCVVDFHNGEYSDSLAVP